MARLEQVTRGAQVKGIVPDGLGTVVDVQGHGSVVIELTYKDAVGHLGHELLFRDYEPTLEVLAPGRLWNFAADGGLLRLASEAYRIRLAYLFDPRLVVHTSLVEPLPHQITAVYGEMLTRQPLRFQLPFEILTNDKLESARTGNWFAENHLVIARLDKLSRDEAVQAKLEQTDWDRIVCDEAHKLSATCCSSGGAIRAGVGILRSKSSVARAFPPKRSSKA